MMRNPLRYRVTLIIRIRADDPRSPEDQAAMTLGEDREFMLCSEAAEKNHPWPIAERKRKREKCLS